MLFRAGADAVEVEEEEEEESEESREVARRKEEGGRGSSGARTPPALNSFSIAKCNINS